MGNKYTGSVMAYSSNVYRILFCPGTGTFAVSSGGVFQGYRAYRVGADDGMDVCDADVLQHRDHSGEVPAYICMESDAVHHWNVSADTVLQDFSGYDVYAKGRAICCLTSNCGQHSFQGSGKEICGRTVIM